jgi:hypothetical protein
VGRYKQEWAKRKQEEEIASGRKAAGEFTRLMSEEEEAWRSEMRVSGRVVGLDVVLQ